MTTDMHAALFFLEMAVILVVCRLVGIVARKLGQPQVMGEMIAGILLGPSFFGWLLPDIQHLLFPEAMQNVLTVVSQIGLVFFMFTVGLDFDMGHLRWQLRSAISVSFTGVVAPLALGGLLAWTIHTDPQLFPPMLPPTTAMLFLGAAMAVTAFPVLSRIIHEHGLIATPLGALALAAGAIDDVVAWCLLAIVLATISGIPEDVFLAIGGGGIYVSMIFALRRWLFWRLESAVQRRERVSSPVLMSVLVLLMLGAWFTDYVGLHAVFGAFMLGVALPRGRLTADVQQIIEPMTVNFLLPLFFVFSGLHTTIGLVLTPFLVGLTIAVIMVACLGKGIACWAVARISGTNQHDAVALGALMNARGLMELIMLNIGLARGIIEPALFTIMVLMAITTTLIATPIFRRAHRLRGASPRFEDSPSDGRATELIQSP